MAKAILTTHDNPYDPVKQFDEWYDFDMLHHYNSCGLLARFAMTSDVLTEEENDREIERAIDEIIKFDPFNIYKKIVVED